MTTWDIAPYCKYEWVDRLIAAQESTVAHCKSTAQSFQELIDYVEREFPEE